MKKNLFSTMLALLTIGAMLVSVGCKNYDDDISDINKRLNELSGVESTLQSQVTTLESKVSSLESTVSTLSSTLTSVKGTAEEALTVAKAAKATAELAATKAELDAVKQTIAAVEALANSKVSQADYDAKVAEINGQIIALGNSVATLSTGLEDANTAISAVKTDLATQVEAFNNFKAIVEGQFTAVQDKFTEVIASINGVQGEVEELLVKVNQNTGDINDLKTAVQDLDGKLAALDSSISGQINTLTAFVERMLTSIVFIPGNGGKDADGNVSTGYVDGVEGVIFGKFDYSPLTGAGINTPDETWKPGNATVHVTPVVTVQFNLNPATFKAEDIKSIKIKDIQDVNFEKTRAASSSDFKLEFVTGSEKVENGVLSVSLKITGTPATEDMITRFNIEVVDSKDRSIVSDYATLVLKDYNNLFIANTYKGEYHLRRGYDGYKISSQDEGTKAELKDKAAWFATQTLAESVTYSDYTCEYTIGAAESIDLKARTGVHYQISEGNCVLLPASKIEALGFAFKYEVVKNFTQGSPVTDQQHFVNLVDGVFTPKTYETEGTSCIGRSPIIRVTLYDKNNNNNVVRVGYIRVTIVRPSKSYDLTVANFNDFYNYDGQKNYTKVADMNTVIYNDMKMSKVEFHTNYPNFEDIPETSQFGIANDEVEPGNESSHVIAWTLSANEIWNNPNKDITNKVRYYNDNGESIYVTLHSHIDDITKVFPVAGYVDNYWDPAKQYTYFNVSVPNTTLRNWDSPANCTFVTNANTPFQTWPVGAVKAGVLKFKENAAKNPSEEDITKIAYFFDKAKIAALDLKVKNNSVVFSVSADGLSLSASATGYTSQVIAKIDNADSLGNQTITYTKSENNDDIASALLNAGKDYMTTCVKAEGYLKGRTDRVVAINFESNDFFNVKFLRPVNMGEKSGGEFTDGVNYGEEGSFIALEKFLNPSDWRGYEFGDYSFQSYWKYYGTQNLSPLYWDIDIQLGEAQVFLNGAWVDLPTTFELKQERASFKRGQSWFGFITYKNNGALLKQDAKIKVPVKVQYGWGVYTTEPIEIIVKATIAQ